VIRRLIKIPLVLVGLVLLYLLFTLAQVWWTSSRDDRPPASAIVVLGAAQYNGVPSPVLKARLDHAAELYRAGVSKMVIVTGAKQAGDKVGEAYAGYDYLKSAGLPESALKIQSSGTDTYEELAASVPILDEAGVGRSVVLVSSPYHAYRATAIAGEVGLQAHFSGAGDSTSFGSLSRETLAVSLGRVISYRRLSNLQD
jgi:uncharacterized SAM-binding protein YcdF (DUF218 family)